MISINYLGRLGNNIFQYVVAVIFSKKFNIPIITQPPVSFIKILNNNSNLVLPTSISNPFEINDNNFLEFLEMENLPYSNIRVTGFFQNIDFIKKYFLEIKEIFNLHYEKKDEDNFFIHYRIGDIEDDRRMLPLEYYEESIEKLNGNCGYISSDTPNHKFVKSLIKKYNLKLYDGNNIETIQFAKNFNKLIISEGTFSWWIAFLSMAKTIICNDRKYKWYGDINLDSWIKLSWDYNEKFILNGRILEKYEPINLKKIK